VALSAIAAGASAIALVPLLVAGVLYAAVGGVSQSMGAGALGAQLGVQGAAADPGEASAAAAAIPAAYLTDFQVSGVRFDVPWGILAGIYQLECDFGRSNLAGCNPRGTENSAGAQGPGQFLPTTWRAGLAPHQLISPGPPTTADAEGFATDGDGDGVADPWDPADAIASTARLLAANGAAKGDVMGAVFAYNHDATYVDEVLALATIYQSTGSSAAQGATGGGDGQPSGVATVLSVARAQLGKPYQWGGAGPASFDCSGLVMVAYGAAGVSFPHNAAAQYAETQAEQVPLASVQPGDLVFFGTSPATIHHVGIVIGDGDMLDAPDTGAVVRIESYNWPDLYAATRPLGG
jgi:peptidoglycan DL-endopeptidase CwlO